MPPRSSDPVNPLSVELASGSIRHCRPGTPVLELLQVEDRTADDLPVVAAMVNHDVVSLSYPLEVDANVEFLTPRHEHGWRVYRASVAFLLAKAVRDLFPAASFSVQHSIGTGLYCSFELHGNPLTDKQRDTLGHRMRELVANDLPIVRQKLAFDDAVHRFRSQGQQDKYNLLRFRNPPKVVTYSCDGFTDLCFGPLAASTGGLGLFELLAYPPGFVLQFPTREEMPHIGPLERQPRLFQVFQEHKEWGRILGVQNVGQLNQIAAANDMDDFMMINEAFHEKKIARIADQIAARAPRPRFILVAGPSASGKTTFAKRLRVQLRVHGLRPVTISVDNYFVDRDQTPRRPDGEYDFEDIQAIDLPLFNEHLLALDRGEEVELPRFDFTLGRRIYKNERLRIEEDQMVIIEGIHCLNPLLTRDLPPEHSFRIYISALTQLNIDANNRISTTDNRLLRRMVRDHRTRGHSALDTLRMWPNVRRGEQTWIFPFITHADATFNSALDYELAVLRPFADPLLTQVKPMHPEYASARFLLQFLDVFLTIPTDAIPANSILREFTGHTAFRY